MEHISPAPGPTQFPTRSPSDLMAFNSSPRAERLSARMTLDLEDERSPKDKDQTDPGVECEHLDESETSEEEDQDSPP